MIAGLLVNDTGLMIFLMFLRPAGNNQTEPLGYNQGGIS